MGHGLHLHDPYQTVADEESNQLHVSGDAALRILHRSNRNYMDIVLGLE